MSIARDAGIISEAQQKEIDALFTGKDGKFDEEAFAEAFARELKRAFHETVQKRMEDVPTTKAGRALRRVADFIVTLAKSFAFWRQERGLDPVTGQPLQAGQVLDAFLKRERTAVDEATRLDNLARAARAASLRATAEARDNAPTQAVVDEDGTVVAYHTAGMDFGSGIIYTQYNKGVSNTTAMSALRLVAGHPISVSPDTLNRSVAILTGTFSPYDNQGRKIRFNPNGTRAKGGSGLLHLVDERVANDYAELYLSGDRDGAIKKAVTDLLRVIEAVQHGHIVEVRGNRNTPNQVILEHKNEADGETYRAVVSWDRKENGFTLTTGYRDVNTGESSVVLRRSEFLTSEYYGHLKRKLPELTRQIVAELFPELQVENRKADPNEERRDHIHVWSGARQAYDRVDLRFIGSGTGGNNEGRGAYSSGVRGVAQDRYAMYKVAEWKEAKEIGFSPDNLPIVYDGKAMRLGVAVGRARSNVRVASEKGISPSIEDEAIIRIYSDAQTYLLDNGFIDYDEFRYYIFSVYVRLSQRLDGLLFTIRSLEKVLSSPREKRMMYKNNKGTAAKWSSTRTFQTESNGEMRDVYVVDDEYGGVNYIDVEYAQKLYEQSKRELEENKDAFKEEQENYEKVRALYDGILPEENPLASETELPLPAVMEQTWFTNRPEGDVSHLISWLDPVTPEQMDWIVEAAEKAGFSEEEIAFLKRDRIDNWDVMIPKGSRVPPSGSEMYMRLELIAMMRDNQFVTFDEVKDYDLWRAHRDVMGDAGKFASEFLLTADIDGVRYPVNYRGGSRHGEEGWNYVAFSDEHLRVDHVYEYNPETDDFELKWHEGVGSGPRFTETPLGQELVARAFDAIMGSRVDLLLRPSRFYGNPYETRERNPRNALVTEHLHRDVDVSEPKGFATEVSAEISRFGTREGDPTLREIRARCGSKARFYEVLGAVYETAEAVRSGLAEVVTGRERAMMSNAGLQAADFIKHNATARATAAGRKLYLMGREFAWKLYQEDIASAWAEVERQRRGRGDCGMIGGKCEGKGPSRHGERRWPKARRMR